MWPVTNSIQEAKLPFLEGAALSRNTETSFTVDRNCFFQSRKEQEKSCSGIIVLKMNKINIILYNSPPNPLLNYIGYIFVEFLIKFCKKRLLSCHSQFRREMATTRKLVIYAVGWDLNAKTALNPCNVHKAVATIYNSVNASASFSHNNGSFTDETNETLSRNVKDIMEALKVLFRYTNLKLFKLFFFHKLWIKIFYIMLHNKTIPSKMLV
jgi:hypothetical protein